MQTLNSKEKVNFNKDLKILATLVHNTFKHWVKYQNSQAIYYEDGSLYLSANKVERWKRQLKMSYFNLSNEEQNSDRQLANEWLQQILTINFNSQSIKQFVEQLKSQENIELISNLEHENWSG